MVQYEVQLICQNSHEETNKLRKFELIYMLVRTTISINAKDGRNCPWIISGNCIKKFCCMSNSSAGLKDSILIRNKNLTTIKGFFNIKGNLTNKNNRRR